MGRSAKIRHRRRRRLNRAWAWTPAQIAEFARTLDEICQDPMYVDFPFGNWFEVEPL
jgi:hypothetical protein